jgi:hypothetical protein
MVVTPLEILVQDRIGEQLDSWLARQRRNGRSYREMAAELQDNYNIPISKSTLHYWVSAYN